MLLVNDVLVIERLETLTHMRPPAAPRLPWASLFVNDALSITSGLSVWLIAPPYAALVPLAVLFTNVEPPSTAMPSPSRAKMAPPAPPLDTSELKPVLFTVSEPGPT